MGHTATCLLVHVVFGTKGRTRRIDAALRARLEAFATALVRDLGCEPVRIGAAADHVHLLVQFPATVAVADAVRAVKANTSRWIHRTWPERRAFGWQAGYGAFSVSPSRREQVAAYIARQDEHHRRLSFREEFRALLEKHGIRLDEPSDTR
ncbi:MAG: IS200/IS605 family transposase [Candidatus Hydrogenedentes bacterium]|nr:IS200/IS605 family transposase [Candidatus Hydrogenedentota bacterium]